MRAYRVHWIGPLRYREAFYVLPSGLYMVFLGQDPIYVGSSTHLSRTMAGHVTFAGSRSRPGDIVGRELLDYSRRYRLPLSVKLARVYDEDGEEVVDELVYRDVVSMLVYGHLFACNHHGRERYEGSAPISIRNTGKSYPLEPEYTSEETDDQERE